MLIIQWRSTAYQRLIVDLLGGSYLPEHGREYVELTSELRLAIATLVARNDSLSPLFRHSDGNFYVNVELPNKAILLNDGVYAKAEALKMIQEAASPFLKNLDSIDNLEQFYEEVRAITL